jgi:hypothetical protein
MLGTLSCTEEDLLISEEMVEPEPTVPIGYLNVDEQLWSLFEKFEAEGKKQGIDIDLRSEDISGEIVEIDEDRVAGQCNFNRTVPNHVTIDREFWNEASDLAKEFVVFHELGHCFLFRDHREDINTNGTCKSLMRSGTGDCRDNYNNFTKGSYLNELFDKRFAGDIFVDPDI